MAIELHALNIFPRVPSPGTITLFEAEARLRSFPSSPDQPADCSTFTDVVKDYHKIEGNNIKPIFPYKISDTSAPELVKSFIVPDDQSLLKGLWTAMMDNGLEGMTQFLRTREPTTNSVRMAKLVDLATSVYQAFQNAKQNALVYIHPHLRLDSTELIETFVPVRDWSSSWIKAMAWHPIYPKLAIVLHDNTIRIFTKGNNIIPMLRSEDQKMVSSVAFRPYATSEVAVGVEKGVLVWEISCSFSIKPRRNQSQLFTAEGHSPVTCVNYSNCGRFLLSSSPVDNSIVVWLRSYSGVETLNRISGGGVPQAMWSPNGQVIYSSTPTSIFRLWEAENKWTPRKWLTTGHPVEAACWSPCSNMLMFACDSCLYVLHLQITGMEKMLNEKDYKSKVVPIFDLRECLVECEDGQLQYKVGGRVRQLVWDKTGTRVALFFDDSEMVALFRVQPSAIDFLDPIGFIRGHPGEYPMTMSFQNEFEDGALLTIAWSDGRIQYLPMIFVTTKMRKNIFHIDNYKQPVPSADYSESLREDPSRIAMAFPSQSTDPVSMYPEPPRLFSTS